MTETQRKGHATRCNHIQTHTIDSFNTAKWCLVKVWPTSKAELHSQVVPVLRHRTIKAYTQKLHAVVTMPIQGSKCLVLRSIQLPPLPPYSLDGRADGPHIRSGRGDDKISLHLLGINLQSDVRPVITNSTLPNVRLNVISFLRLKIQAFIDIIESAIFQILAHSDERTCRRLSVCSNMQPLTAAALLISQVPVARRPVQVCMLQSGGVWVTVRQMCNTLQLCF